MEEISKHQVLSPPVLAAMDRNLASGRSGLGRRSFLASLGMTACVGALGGCGIPPATETSRRGEQDMSGAERSVTFSNWPLYIDVDEKDQNIHPTLQMFTRQTGIRVNYIEDVNDNNDFFGKIKPQLSAGQGTGRDLMVLTDWMAARLIRLGWVEKLDQGNLPHAYANLDQRFRGAAWDPGRSYSYPWAGIQAVIAYNAKATRGKKVESISQLLEDPALKGKVTMLTEMRDSIGLTLLDMGVDPATVTERQFDAAITRIQKAVDRKQIRRFTGNEYAQELASGDIAACVAWGGDLIQLRVDNPDIEFVVPDAGYMSSTDNLIIPAKARHKKNAELLIDHYYRPDVAARLTVQVNYVSPVAGVRQELEKIDKDAARNPLILPDAAMAAKAHVFRALTLPEESRFEEKFSALIGA